MGRLLSEDGGAMLQADAFFILLEGDSLASAFAGSVEVTRDLSGRVSVTEAISADVEVTRDLSARMRIS